MPLRARSVAGMHPLLALLAIAGLIVVVTVIGLVWRARNGRLRGATTAADAAPRAPQASPAGDGALTPADLGGSAPFGATATLVQFSTEFCARCPAARRLLGEVASTRDGVVHLDVDLTHRADLARRFKVFQTPTTVVLGPDGVPTARVNGLPRRTEIIAHLDGLHTSDHHHRIPEGNGHANAIR